MCVAANADTIKLRDGRVFIGQFLGATRTEIWFQHDSPEEILETAAYPIPEVLSLTFGPVNRAERSGSSSSATAALVTPRSAYAASGLARAFASIWKFPWRSE